MKLSTVIVGASGYSGAELVKLLSAHPDVEISAITSTTLAGKSIAGLYPHLYGLSELRFTELSEKEAAGADVVFLALPHGRAIDLVPRLKAAGPAKIIDLSGDFRLPGTVYEAWYETPHTAPELTNEAVYGLSELNADQIRNADLVANPGCFPTGVILATAPLFSAGVTEPEVTVTSLTGVSGAGRKLLETTQFCRVDESASAYKAGGRHQHIPEMEQALDKLATGARVSFTPILAPVNRGIYSTVTASLTADVSEVELHKLINEFYDGHEFINVLPLGTMPELKNVSGSNYCHIGVALDDRLKIVNVISAIDNLVKGAAGQAVQNMNLIFNLDETAGLKQPGLYP